MTVSNPIPITLEEAVACVQQHRQRENELQQEYRETLAASPINTIEMMLAEVGEYRRSAEALVRSLATDEYEATGSKKLAAGVGIRVSQVVEINGEDGEGVLESVLIAWAAVHAPSLIHQTIDSKGLERIVKALPEADRPAWARIEERVTVTIPRELKV